jgi:Reverse transcriptase (RNA-dependent DNA polymerase)
LWGQTYTFVDKKKKACLKHWECHDTGDVTEFLGIHVTCDVSKIKLDQQKYLKNVLDHFNMSNAKIAQTPLLTGWTPMENKAVINPAIRQKYQSVFGSLLYLMLGTRPDITFAVIKMSVSLTTQTHDTMTTHATHTRPHAPHTDTHARPNASTRTCQRILPTTRDHD